MSLDPKVVVDDLFKDSDEVGALMRSHDWAQTPLGAVEHWPLSLKSALNILLNVKSPAFLIWERERLLFQNDAYRALSKQHQAAPMSESEPVPPRWAESWSTVEADIEQVFATGQPLQRQHQPWLDECQSSNPDTEFDCSTDSYSTDCHHSAVPCFNWSCSAIWDENGQVGGVMAIGSAAPDAQVLAPVCEEIQQAQVALHQSKQRYQTLFESIDEGFCVVEVLFNQAGQPVDYRFLEANPAFERQCGLTNALGKRMRELVPDMEPYWFDLYGRVVLTGESQRFEDRAEALDRWFDVSAFRIGSPEDCKVGILFSDITIRKRIELRLRDSEEQFRNMADHAPFMVWVTDSTGFCTYLSQSWYDFTGQTAASGLGFGWLSAVHPDDYEAAKQIFLAANQQQVGFRLEYRLRDRDGSYIWAIDAANPWFDEDGQYQGYIGSVIDITDRKQAEEVVRESEEQRRNILESISDAFFAVDETWLFTYLNQAAQLLLAPNLIGKNIWEAYPGLSSSEFGQLYRCVLSDQVAGSLTAFYPDHDRWYEVHAYPSANGITVYFQNVTERKQAEDRLRQVSAELKQQIRQFDGIASAVPDFIYRFDRTGRFTYVNQPLLNLWQKSAAEVLGKTCAELDYSPEMAALMQNQIQQVIETGESLKDETAYTSVSGTGFYEYIFVPLFDQTGVVEAVAGVTRNITERQQTEASLKARNERLKLLSEIANDLLLSEDPKIFLASLFERVAAHLGLEVYFNYLFDSEHDCLQLHAYGGISAEVAESARLLKLGEGVCGHVAKYRRPTVVEQALDAADTPLAVPVQSIGIRAYASHPLLVGNRVLGTLGLGTRQRDRFTADELELMQVIANQVAVALERSHLVAELQERAEALVQSNRIKDEFLAVLSHELRTPLNPILGWSRLLQQGNLDDTKMHIAIATIERNAKLQAQLIEDMLDISRILQGKMSLAASPVNLSAVIAAALETVRLAAEAKSIQIQTLYSPLTGLVIGDAGRLQQVIWNLLSNAIKFTSQGGQVTVSLAQVGNQAQIQVADTGKGIQADFLPHVFEHFRQEDGATTRKFGGLGLGLAIVRQITELHGGTVKAESAGEDQGSCFTVLLPIAPRPVPEFTTHSSAGLQRDLSGVQVLIVDDEADSRDLLAFVLEQASATVQIATSGAEALAAIADACPQLIISDIGMPEMDGYMLMRQIRALPPQQGGQIPAIALTAYAGEIDQQQAIAAGFQLHLAKPIDAETVVTVIAKLIE